jgi:hypothetical protein
MGSDRIARSTGDDNVADIGSGQFRDFRSVTVFLVDGMLSSGRRIRFEC